MEDLVYDKEYFTIKSEDGKRIMFYCCRSCDYEKPSRSMLMAHLKTKKHKSTFQTYLESIQEEIAQIRLQQIYDEKVIK